jgi:hypothetical protein
VTGRERTLGEIDRDLERLTRDFDQLQARLHNGAFVRADLHNEQIANLRGDIKGARTNLGAEISGVRTMQMWMLGILASLLIAAVTTGIALIAQGL